MEATSCISSLERIMNVIGYRMDQGLVKLDYDYLYLAKMQDVASRLPKYLAVIVLSLREI